MNSFLHFHCQTSLGSTGLFFRENFNSDNMVEFLTTIIQTMKNYPPLFAGVFKPGDFRVFYSSASKIRFLKHPLYLFCNKYRRRYKFELLTLRFCCRPMGSKYTGLLQKWGWELLANQDSVCRQSLRVSIALINLRKLQILSENIYFLFCCL